MSRQASDLDLLALTTLLRLIIEQSAEYRSDLHLVFVDFEKAFDNVDRERLWMALRRRGMPNKLVQVGSAFS